MFIGMQSGRLSLLLIAAAAVAVAQSSAPNSQEPQPEQVWQMQDSGTTAGLRGVYSVDGTVAWASGTEGTVLKTTDGGAHWQQCALPDTDADGITLDFRGVQAWDADTAIVMASGPGEASRLYKTSDGCASWDLLLKNPDSPDGFFDSFWFDSVYGDGILLGDPVKGRFVVLETDNGGLAWTEDTSGELATSGSARSAFAASNSAIARTGHRYFPGFVTGGKSGAVFYQGWDPSGSCRSLFHPRRSILSDSQGSMSAIPLASGSDSSGGFSLGLRLSGNPCHDCGLSACSRLIAVGGDFTKPNESSGTAAWSSDGGQHWTASSTPPHGYRSTVQWSEPLKFWIAAGTNGSDISRDDGRTWHPLDNGNWTALSLPFIVGPKGRVARLNPAALSPAK
jgi:photosystem II stability/assembly factor-like uncharacterized protein